MNENQQKQTEHYLNEFTKLSNKFFDDGEKDLSEYWKGQVMGICKMITLLKLEDQIDITYYLNRLY